MEASKVLEDNLEILEMEEMAVLKASKDLEEMVDLKILEGLKEMEGWHNFREKEVLVEAVEEVGEVKVDMLLVKTQAQKHQQWMAKQQRRLL